MNKLLTCNSNGNCKNMKKKELKVECVKLAWDSQLGISILPNHNCYFTILYYYGINRKPNSILQTRSQLHTLLKVTILHGNSFVCPTLWCQCWLLLYTLDLLVHSVCGSTLQCVVGRHVIVSTGFFWYPSLHVYSHVEPTVPRQVSVSWPFGIWFGQGLARK